MANVGDNFTPESSALTSQALDGRSNASLDYFEESMNGFFERLNEKLSQAGINLPLPQLDFFDSGNSSGSQQGGERTSKSLMSPDMALIMTAQTKIPLQSVCLTTEKN